MLAAQAGAEAVIVSHENLEKAQHSASECSARYGVTLEGADGSDDDKVCHLLSSADLVFSAAKAGVEVLNGNHLSAAQQVRVFCDVNAVPPAGIEGVGAMDNGTPVEGTPAGAVGIGALAVGNIKYKTQQALLHQMIDSKSAVFLDFRQAFEVARESV
jgi:methylene-tetrahydromethanopterin dehydrogenase